MKRSLWKTFIVMSAVVVGGCGDDVPVNPDAPMNMGTDGGGDVPAQCAAAFAAPLNGAVLAASDDKDGDGCANGFQVDVRLVAATNRGLRAQVAQRRFREDLFFRLSVFPITVPPLRDRAGDIPTLAAFFVERFCRDMKKKLLTISPAALERLTSYHWPGNVRELQNCIERAVALAAYGDLVLEDLPEKLRAYRRSHVVVAAEDPSDLVTMDELERRYIGRVLEATGGNKSAAAKILGFDRTTLYRKLVRYGLDGEPG